MISRGGPVIYLFAKLILAPLARVVYRPKVTGRENIPRHGPFIIASNHLAFADSAVIPFVCPRRVVFLAKDDYFHGPGVRGLLVKWWFTATGMVPVDRDDTRSAQASLDRALEILATGEGFGIYPEGTRSRDGRLYRGRTGVAWLAMKSGAPIVPVALAGTEHIQPGDTRVPRIRKVSVRFGEPIVMGSRFEGVPTGRARRQLTDDVMSAIHAMSGQELAGQYNSHPTDP
jgi:1-acyl-sn-glycerol-3-phosphate acyltransferase